MQKLSSKQLVTVYMTTRLNENRLHQEPPRLPNQVQNASLRQALAATLNDSARSWDIYRDVVQLSFLWEGCSYHFMMCDHVDGESVSIATEIENTPTRSVRTYSDESRMIADAFALVNEMYGVTADGLITYPRLMAGWRMTGAIWPVLVNRAIKYDISVPSDMLVAPDVKWTTGHFLGDIANLYIQGGAGFRSLPGLADLLKFWGFEENDGVMVPEDIETAVCDQPLVVADTVDAYLNSMFNVLCRYYNVKAAPAIPTSIPMIP